jgi:hypothetical protein
MKHSKVSEPIGRHERKVPVQGTREHRLWLSRVVEGKRKARARRHELGLRTVRETATEYGVSPKFVQRLVDRGVIATIDRFIHQREAARVFSGHQEGTAA